MSALIARLPSSRLWIPLLFDYGLVIVLGMALDAGSGWGTPATLPVAAGLVAVAVAVSVVEIRLRRAYLKQAVPSAESSVPTQRPWGLPAQINPADLGFLANGDRGALLSMIAWLRAAGTLVTDPQHRHVQVAAAAAPRGAGPLGDALRRLAGSPEGLYLPGLNPLSHYARPDVVTREMTALRDRLASRGLLDSTIWQAPSTTPAWHRPWPVAVIAFGLAVAPSLLVADASAASWAMLLAMTAMLTWTGHPATLPTPRRSTPTDGQWVVEQARRQHRIKAGETDPRAIAVLVALHGDDALQQLDPELHEIVRAGLFYKLIPDPLFDNGW
ncbi:hypothetical protein AB0F81_45140 [Actinoplanes sp. NPDC024001]|uniref:hypothetical protein n=1 Tax=Actinoplanes sp. NPDC024001 TaxID=3154598 RepID=UPI00340B428F